MFGGGAEDGFRLGHTAGYGYGYRYGMSTRDRLLGWIGLHRGNRRIDPGEAEIPAEDDEHVEDAG